jgi:hypothetical protein
MLAPSTTGENRCSTARISALFLEHSFLGTGTHIAPGHNRSALAIGIADLTPNFLVSYDAEHTTPLLSAAPPTMSNFACPAPSGSTILATAT